MMEHLLGQIPPRLRDGRGPRPRLRAALCLLVLAGASGCAGIHVNESRLRNAIDDRRERALARYELDGGTGELLYRHGLLEQAANDPAGAAQALTPRLEERPEPNGALALAELSYRAGLEHEGGASPSAIAWYRDAAALAALAVGDSSGTQPERATELHNRAVARL